MLRAALGGHSGTVTIPHDEARTQCTGMSKRYTAMHRRVGRRWFHSEASRDRPGVSSIGLLADSSDVRAMTATIAQVGFTEGLNRGRYLRGGQNGVPP